MSDKHKQVAAHAEIHTLHIVDVDPDHGERTESPEFKAAKERLHADGHYRCYICGGTDNLRRSRGRIRSDRHSLSAVPGVDHAETCTAGMQPDSAKG